MKEKTNVDNTEFLTEHLPKCVRKLKREGWEDIKIETSEESDSIVYTIKARITVGKPQNKHK